MHKAAGLPLLLLGAWIVSLAAGCAPPAAPPPDPPPAQEVSRPQQNPVDDWLAAMTLAEKVGQMFWFGLPGPAVNGEVEQLIAEGKVGGFILFARQGSEPESLRNLTASLQRLAAERERPSPGLLISVDHEGGLVQRFGPPFTRWPGSMALGAAGSEALAEQVARAMARELRAAGINMNLAPVADVNNNPANPVIGVRSFGEDPERVARLVSAQIAGFQAEQVSAVAKHFPGHGDTDLDSHLALPLVGHDRARLDAVELVPFRSAIAAGVDAIMTAHVTFPAVATDGLPATLSPLVLSGLLREELGYEGVVVTDAMDVMKAITDSYGLEQGLIMAIQAGADAVLVTESFGLHRALHGLVLKAVQDGRIPASRVEEAARRILRLKEKRGLLPGRGSRAAEPGPEAIGAAAHQELARQVGARALTLVRNQHLPLALTSEQMALVISPSFTDRVRGTAGISTPLGAGVKAHHDNVWEVTLDRRPSAGSLTNARTLGEQAAVIIYGVYNGHRYEEHAAFLQELIATGKPVVVVGLGEPYELTRIPGIETYLAAYGYQEPNLHGVGAVLFGQASPTGRLPVSIPDLYPAGHGLSY